MNHRNKTLTTILLVMVILGVTYKTSFAFPPLPSSFYGIVGLNGENVPDGTLVEALIENEVIAETLTETYQGNSVYTIDIPGDDPSTEQIEGGMSGNIIQFKVGGQDANQTGQWQSGTNQNLDLSVTLDEIILPPQPTRTPLPTQTPITYSSQPTPTSTQNISASAVLPSSEASLTPTESVTDQPVSEPSENKHSKVTVITNADGNEQSSDDFPIADTGQLKAAVVDETNSDRNSLLWLFIPAVLISGSVIIYLRLKKAKINHENGLEKQ